MPTVIGVRVTVVLIMIPPPIDLLDVARICSVGRLRKYRRRHWQREHRAT
jgi:hypothetical protein